MTAKHVDEEQPYKQSAMTARENRHKSLLQFLFLKGLPFWNGLFESSPESVMSLALTS